MTATMDNSQRRLSNLLSYITGVAATQQKRQKNILSHRPQTLLEEPFKDNTKEGEDNTKCREDNACKNSFAAMLRIELQRSALPELPDMHVDEPKSE